jgi:hypothetical protein
MATALDLISGSLRLIGALGQGQSPTGQEGSNGLDALNDMVDAWSAERLAIYTINRLVFNLTSGKQDYTMGTGADFDTPRPISIQNAGVILTTNPSQPLELPIAVLTTDQWSLVAIKNLVGSGTFPTAVYPDGGFPNQKLSFWPIPMESGLQVALYPWQPLAQFADLTTTVSFPPGYAEALRFYLAVRLAPEYGRPTPPEVAAIARTSKAKIKIPNIEPLRLTIDNTFESAKYTYNWLDDNASV